MANLSFGQSCFKEINWLLFNRLTPYVEVIKPKCMTLTITDIDVFNKVGNIFETTLSGDNNAICMVGDFIANSVDVSNGDSASLQDFFVHMFDLPPTIITPNSLFHIYGNKSKFNVEVINTCYIQLYILCPTTLVNSQHSIFLPN